MLLLKDAGSRLSWKQVFRLVQLGCIALGIVAVVSYLTGNVTRSSFTNLIPTPLAASKPSTTPKASKAPKKPAASKAPAASKTPVASKVPAASKAPVSSKPPAASIPTVWKGWKATQHLFVFGDSYSDQGFDPSGAQPTPQNPFGNPQTPLDLSIASVWLRFLSLNYNQSFVRTYNLARGGSVVNADIVMPLFNMRNASFDNQLSERFNVAYASKPGSAPWRADNSLFAVWFGINDIVLSAANDKHTPLKKIMASYRAKIKHLYRTGARNFLLINVPPTHKAHAHELYTKREAKDIKAWNKALLTLRNDLVKTHSDLTAFVFDVHTLWEDTFNDNKQFAQTAGLTQLGDPCIEYAMGTLFPAQKMPQCAAPANEYFFQNELHTTYPVHNLTASMVVRDCLEPPVRRGYCL